MNNLELLTKLVAALGLNYDDVVKYWQSKGCITEEKNNVSQACNTEDIVSDIRYRIKNILTEYCDFHSAEEISEEFRLDYDLILDSLDRTEVIMRLEKEFALNIPEEHANRIITVQDIID